MSEVHLQRVTKSWGATPALDQISFSAGQGRLVVLLGPSGCGKSTTLRLIAGLETATSGTIYIAGRNVTHLAPSKRGVSMVFQNYALFPHLSVAENIVFGLKVRNVPRSEREARLSRAATVLGLQALLDRKPSQLSGGQQITKALNDNLQAALTGIKQPEPAMKDAQAEAERNLKPYR